MRRVVQPLTLPFSEHELLRKDVMKRTLIMIFALERMAMPNYFELEVSLLEIKPRIWRRFLIHSEATFMNLHYAIQGAFGWNDCHLYEFLDGKVEADDARLLYALKLPRIARSAHAGPYEDEPDVPEADGIELREYFSEKDRHCFYVYDFGDYWQHEVKLKSETNRPEEFTRRLLGGARACPPDDCGGTIGYEECCEVVGMSKTDILTLDAYAKEERESTLDWLDGWEPEVFAFEEVKKIFDR